MSEDLPRHRSSLSPDETRLAAIVDALRETIALLVDRDVPDSELGDIKTRLDKLNERLAGCPVIVRDPELVHPVRGVLNPVAPPLTVWLDADTTRASTRLSNAYRGPTGSAQGGVIAAAFESVLGWAPRFAGHFSFAAELTVRYRAPIPLHTHLQFEARVERVAGRKSWVSAALIADEQRCAEAEGLFITPASRG